MSDFQLAYALVSETAAEHGHMVDANSYCTHLTGCILRESSPVGQSAVVLATILDLQADSVQRGVDNSEYIAQLLEMLRNPAKLAKAFSESWTQTRGPRGGTIWVSPTGKKRYGNRPPDPKPKRTPTDIQEVGKAAKAIASGTHTQEDVEKFSQALAGMTYRELRAFRREVSATFGRDATRKEQMIGKLKKQIGFTGPMPQEPQAQAPAANGTKTEPQSKPASKQKLNDIGLPVDGSKTILATAEQFDDNIRHYHIVPVETEYGQYGRRQMRYIVAYDVTKPDGTIVSTDNKFSNSYGDVQSAKNELASHMISSRLEKWQAHDPEVEKERTRIQDLRKKAADDEMAKQKAADDAHRADSEAYQRIFGDVPTPKGMKVELTFGRNSSYPGGTVKGIQIGEFVVHNLGQGHWDMTHIKSGLKLNASGSQDQARKMADYLSKLPGVNWDFTEKPSKKVIDNVLPVVAAYKKGRWAELEKHIKGA
jgi:hypothetical protein